MTYKSTAKELVRRFVAEYMATATRTGAFTYPEWCVNETGVEYGWPRLTTVSGLVYRSVTFSNLSWSKEQTTYKNISKETSAKVCRRE